MATPQPQSIQCPPGRTRAVLLKARCNGARDCIPSDALQRDFDQALCNALNFISPNQLRTAEIWTPDGQKKITTITGNWANPYRLGRCNMPGGITERPPGANAPPDPYTVDIPGIHDILKAPALEPKRLRYERYLRWKTRNSAIPEFLQWIPPLLNKLDDAQDMLFTVLALTPFIARLIPRFFLGPLGILFTINDILNMTT